MWSFVCFLLATVSGYRSLAAEFRIEDGAFDGMEPVASPFYAMLGVSSYRGGTMSLRADRIGLGIRVWRLFPFHPAIRIPWDRVGRAEGVQSSWRNRFLGGVMVLNGRSTFRTSEDTMASIEAARSRLAGGRHD